MKPESDDLSSKWQACQEGKYQHRFREIDKPFKMVGKLIRWVSICGRAYCYDPPMVNERIKRCRYCEETNGPQP